MVELVISLDEEVNFEVTGHPSDQTAALCLELSPARAMHIWLILEDRLEHEGLIWTE